MFNMAKCVVFCAFLCVQSAFCQSDETCQTVDNEIGSCINVRSCEPYLRLANESESNRDDFFTLLKRAKCGFEGNDLKVCCPRSGFPSKPATTSTTTTPQPETPPPREVAELRYLDSLPAYPVCGKISEDMSKVLGGEPAHLEKTCQTVDNKIGSCIPILSCEPYLRLANDSGSNPDTVQLLRRAHCGFEGNNTPKVCCPRPGFPSKPATINTINTLYLTDEAMTIVGGEPAREASKLASIVDGEPALLGAFPWMALLGYKTGSGRRPRWLCGGSLVSSRHVLTAAHCIHLYENSLFLVRLGELDLSTESDGATPVDVLIEKMIKHEKYNHELHTNDIGLLWLDKDVQFTSLIRPVCLPEANNLRSMIYYNHMPIVAGWGSVEFHGPTAFQLQVGILPVVSNIMCANTYYKYTDVKIDENIICAGYLQDRTDACEGDSGGPLMIPVYFNETSRQTPIYQIGVASSGRRCAKTGFPGIFTRVTYYMPWLQEKMLGIAAH